MSEKINSKRVTWIDCFRITAIFTMMLIHTSASQYFRVPVDSFDWLIFHIYDSIAQVSVPCFVMISGILFLNPEKEITVKNLFKKNIWRMVTAYIFWDFLYVLFDYYVMDVGEIQAVNEIFNGHYHLWYLFTIAGLYLITPILRQIVKEENVAKYFIVVSTVVAVVIPTIRYNAFINKYTGGIIVNANLSFLTNYAVYFVLGYLLYKSDISHTMEKIIYVFGIIGLAMTILLSYYVAMREKTATAYYSNFSLFIYMQSIAVFVFFKNKVGKVNFNEKSKKIISILAECSFGMYLIHEFFNMIFTKIGFITTSFNAIFSVPIINSIVFILSFICIYLLRKCQIFRKYFS